MVGFSYEDYRNSPLMRSLETNNWNNDDSNFHVFNTQDELNCYLLRSEDGEWWDEEKGCYDFERCAFNFEVDSWLAKKEFDSDVNFESAEFKGKASFKGITFKGQAKFSGCTFEKDVDFSGVKFKSNFYPCIFDSNVNFSGTKFSKSVDFFGFRKEALFDNCIFEKVGGFSKTFFEERAFFRKCTFEENVSFEESTFRDDVFFHDTTFNRNVDFEASEFTGKFHGWDIKCIGGGISFKWVNFRKKANLSNIKVEYNGEETYTVQKQDTDGINPRYFEEEVKYLGKLDLYGANFEGNAYFYDAKINILDLTKSVIDKGVFFLNAKILFAERETLRIIKHEFKKQDNRIEGLKYHALEMEKYEDELFGIRKRLKSPFISILRDFYLVFKKEKKADKFILFINRISNEHNTNPFRGVKFTLLTTLILYLIFIYSIKIEQEQKFILDYSFAYLGENIKQMLQLLNLTNWEYYPFGLEYKWSYLILFFSRIVIGFGLYQTIQAFRKFGKL